MVFQKSSVMRHAIKGEQVSLIEELNNLVTKHKQSPMVFQRKDKLVISNNHYRLKTLTVEDVKKYLPNAKLFILKVNNILKEYVR